MSAWQESVGLKRAIAEADPADLGARYDLLIAERAIAVTNRKLGNADAARASLRRLVAETAALSTQDPENAGWSELAEKARRDLADLNSREE